MPKSYVSLTLYDAKTMLRAVGAKAKALAIVYNSAVVDARGYRQGFVRQDGTLTANIDLAIDKAVTARIFDKATSDPAKLSQSGKPLFDIQEGNEGKVIIFGGGISLMVDGTIIAAIGTSAGTVEQDIEVAEAAVACVAGEDCF